MKVEADYTSEEMMIIAAARRFRDDAACFVGVGLPSTAACLARSLQAPNAILVYESGAIGARPSVAPLSVADPDLADTAVVIASLSEVFSYWLQRGRVDIGFLGAAQIDRFGNINSTVIGDYDSPKVRMPGAGGAPHIAANVKEIVVIVRHAAKAFVRRVDFVTTRACKGSISVVTDMGILEAHRASGELVLTSLHPGTTLDGITEATGWPLIVADRVEQTQLPSEMELAVLRDLNARTAATHRL
jgi:glutaconate CoA-transferase subunit B